MFAFITQKYMNIYIIFSKLCQCFYYQIIHRDLPVKKIINHKTGTKFYHAGKPAAFSIRAARLSGMVK
jgi:hypothetical protein